MLSANEMKRTVFLHGLESVKHAGGVTSDENSLWLLDFWGKKDVAGLLLMPPTRHVIFISLIVVIRNSVKIEELCQQGVRAMIHAGYTECCAWSRYRDFYSPMVSPYRSCGSALK